MRRLDLRSDLSLQPSISRVPLTCSETGLTRQAEVLSRSLLELRVVVVGSNLPLRLSRKNPSKAFVGTCAGLEFSCKP